jgi:hypothetical protein
MGNVLSEPKREVIALGLRGWSLWRIEQSWFRHAPGEYTNYEAVVIPGVNDADGS